MMVSIHANKFQQVLLHFHSEKNKFFNTAVITKRENKTNASCT